MGSPSTGRARSPFRIDDRAFLNHLWNAAIGWTLAYGLAALALLAATLKTFDRCLGRVEGRAQPQPGPSLESERMVRRRAEA